MDFTNLGLDERVASALADMGYRSARPIQAAAAPPILAGRDVIGLAQTGMGKTAAFGAPLVQLIRETWAGEAVIRGLVICPTRELARQVSEEIKRIALRSPLKVTCVFGKTGIRAQVDAIAAGVDIIVGTPGRINDLLEGDHLSLAHVRHAVVDEADRMLDMGFLPQVRRILDRVPTPRQMLLFTATMPNAVEELARRFLVEPERVEVGRHTTTVDHVKQRMMAIDDRNKVPLLLHLLGEGRKGVLVFCRTRRRVGWVGAALRRHNIRVGVLHGDRSQAQRQRALDSFAEGRLDVVVATEVASRGLHVPAVRTVINYDVPLTAEEYVHRIGRAGHGSRQRADAITFVSNREEREWGAIRRRLDIDPPRGLPDGFVAPNVDPRRDKRGSSSTSSRKYTRGGKDSMKGEPQRRVRRRAGGSSRARRSAPVPKNQKPGGGVKKPKNDGA